MMIAFDGSTLISKLVRLSFLFCTVACPSLNSLHGVNFCDLVVTFAHAPRLDAQYVMDDSNIMQNVCDDNLLDDNLLFVMDCDAFRSHVCAVGTELETSKFVTGRFQENSCTRAGLIGSYLLVIFRYRRRLTFIFRSLD